LKGEKGTHRLESFHPANAQGKEKGEKKEKKRGQIAGRAGSTCSGKRVSGRLYDKTRGKKREERGGGGKKKDSGVSSTVFDLSCHDGAQRLAAGERGKRGGGGFLFQNPGGGNGEGGQRGASRQLLTPACFVRIAEGGGGNLRERKRKKKKEIEPTSKYLLPMTGFPHL